MTQERKQYYETHITLMCSNVQKLETAVALLGWKFSRIADDIELGKGVKCYVTRQYNFRWQEQWVRQQVITTADKLREQGFTVLREKVELVLFDNICKQRETV